jgi:CHC2 zinc finger
MLATHSPRDIAVLVSMSQLLHALGFEANERTRRCACILHGGSNRSAFSWTETGLWKCHSCGAGGDRIALVRAVRGCTFAEAVGFLAKLADIEVEQSKSSRADNERMQRERQAEERLARLLANAEQGLLLELIAELDSLHRLRRVASEWLASGRKPELCWDALRFVADTLPRTDTAYCIAAFAAGVERAKFALHQVLRPAMIDAALERGFVTKANGDRLEVPLQ